jgi:hypothetical protein
MRSPIRLKIATVVVALAVTPVLASHLSGYTAPTGLSAVVSGDNVVLTWATYAAFPSGCTGGKEIRIQRRDNGGDFNQITSVDDHETGYIDQNLANGTYEYRIQARCNVPAIPGVSPADANNLSLFSDTATAVVTSAPACSGPPTLSTTASPAVIWPPNGKTMAVTISGTVAPATNCSAPATVLYLVHDEYGELTSSTFMPVPVESSAFTFQVSLEASRRGDDLDGRLYTITLQTPDGGAGTVAVIVPHDQRKK